MVKNISILILLGLVVFLLFALGRTTNHSDIAFDIGFYQTLSYDYRSLIKQDQTRFLCDDIVIVDSNDSIIAYKSVFDKRKLVVRYSNLDCNVCVDSIIKYSKLLATDIGRDKIVVCAKYDNKRDFHLLSRINKNVLDIYKVDDTLLNLDDKGTPYMFVINDDNTISHVFIPHKEYPNLMMWYFDVVKKYLIAN